MNDLNCVVSNYRSLAYSHNTLNNKIDILENEIKNLKFANAYKSKMFQQAKKSYVPNPNTKHAIDVNLYIILRVAFNPIKSCIDLLVKCKNISPGNKTI